MFDALQERLGDALKSLAGKARLTEANMRDGLTQVQQALLEADVSFSVVKDFMSQVARDAMGEKVLRSLNPSQQVVGIVFKQLVDLLGPVDHSLHLRGDPAVIMLCGLQGAGKTTTCGKLARTILDKGKKPLLVAADLQRPAAVEQLKVIGGQLKVSVFAEAGAQDPVVVCQNAVRYAKLNGQNVVILDTAGRLHIDQELMAQLQRIDRRVQPDQVLLVVDGMTGQDAVQSAKSFNDALELDGVIMTKLDGDARGGAALSVKAVTGVPLKFMGTGEHLDALEEFHPERIAQRILGMGDVLTLVETAQKKMDQDEMARLQERSMRGEWTLDDFRKMMTQATKLGPMGKVLGMIPGMGQITKMLGDGQADKEMRRLCGMIDSMTPAERRNPKLIDTSRRRRIAAGCGVDPAEINSLVKQFDGMAGMMKQMSSLGTMERMQALEKLQRGGLFNPGGPGLAKQKQGTGKRLTAEEKAQARKQRERELKKRKRDGNA